MAHSALSCTRHIRKPLYFASCGHRVFVRTSAAENMDTGQKVAIKKVLNAFADTLDAKRILREVKLMKHFNHENVRLSFTHARAPCTQQNFSTFSMHCAVLKLLYTSVN